MKKRIASVAALCAIACAATSIPFSQSVSAEDGPLTYTQFIEADSFAVSAEDAASGNVKIPMSIYLKGKVGEDLNVSTYQCKLETDSNQVYFRDISDPTAQHEDYSDYSVLGKEFRTKYEPFCFGTLTDIQYVPLFISCETTKYCSNPASGTIITYHGDDTISFLLSGKHYVDENGELAQDNYSHEIICPLTRNEDGSASYSFKYASVFVDHAEVMEAHATIPYYQPELLKVGDMIPDSNDIICWISEIGKVYSHFLGNSDDFPFFHTDFHLKEGTPCGIYNVGFDVDDCSFIMIENSTDINNIPMVMQGTAVVVGAEKAQLLGVDDQPQFACFYANSNKNMTANAMGARFSAKVGFTDGTEQEADVTNAVNLGTNPSALYEERGSFAGELPLYCGDTPMTDETGAAVTQAVGVGLKGDVNMDGSVDINDAAEALKYYAAVASGNKTARLTKGDDENLETLAYFLTDIDTQSQNRGADGGKIDINDVANILQYYAAAAAGQQISWDKFRS